MIAQAGFLEPTIEITHRRWQADGEDPYGNTVAEFVDVPVLVYGWWVPGSETPRAGDESITAGRDGVVADVTFLAPDFPVDDRDEFLIPEFASVPLRVSGERRPYNYGPFGWRPGMQIALKFAEG